MYVQHDSMNICIALRFITGNTYHTYIFCVLWKRFQWVKVSMLAMYVEDPLDEFNP